MAGGTPAGDIAVLCRTKSLMRPIEAALARRGVPLQSMNALAFRRFDWRSPSVKLLTLHSAKGLEFALVCVAGLQAAVRARGDDLTYTAPADPLAG